MYLQFILRLSAHRFPIVVSFCVGGNVTSLVCEWVCVLDTCICCCNFAMKCKTTQQTKYYFHFHSKFLPSWLFVFIFIFIFHFHSLETLHVCTWHSAQQEPHERSERKKTEAATTTVSTTTTATR